MSERLHFGTTLQARAFRWLSRTPITQESLVAYLRDCTGVAVDPSLVGAWKHGRRPADLEVWLLALEHAGEEAHLVLDGLAAEHGCVVVRLPTSDAAVESPSRRALLIAALAGEVARLTAEAAEDGIVTPSERVAILGAERALARALAAPVGPVGPVAGRESGR